MSNDIVLEAQAALDTEVGQNTVKNPIGDTGGEAVSKGVRLDMEVILLFSIILIFMTIGAFALGFLLGSVRSRANNFDSLAGWVGSTQNVPKQEIVSKPPTLEVIPPRKRPTQSAVLKYPKPSELKKQKEDEAMAELLAEVVNRKRDSGTIAV